MFQKDNFEASAKKKLEPLRGVRNYSFSTSKTSILGHLMFDRFLTYKNIYSI